MGLEDIMKKESGNYKDVVFISDMHIPYHDIESTQSVIEFVKHKKPSTVILGGDIVDFYTVSSYDKDPSRIHNIQDELDQCSSFLDEVQKASKNSEFIYLEGNHEHRLIRYLHRNPELYPLRNLRMEKLLDLKERGIKYKKDHLVNSFLFKHGDFAPKYAAAKELDIEGTSGMSGHVHRIQEVTKTDRSGAHSWYSNGHLSDTSYCDYINSAINWQQGIGYVTFRDKKKFNSQIIHIIDNEFTQGDYLYTPRGRVKLKK